MEYYYCQRKPDYFQKAIDNLHYCEKLQQAFTTSYFDKQRAQQLKNDSIGGAQMYDQ